MRNAQVKASQAVAALLLLLSWMPVSAQSISSVTGTLQHNAQVTVVGSGFGTKTQAGPVVWDNMESGSFSPLWSSTGSPGTLNVNSDNQRHDNSHYNGMANFVGNQYVEHASFTGGSNSPRWYCQYWFKLGTDWNWGTATNGGLGSNLANVKFFRMWSTGSATDNWVCATEGWSNSCIYKSSGPINESDWFSGGFKEDWTLGQWHLFQFEYKDSSQRGVRDGSVKIWFDGELILNDSTLLTRSVAGSADGEFMRPYGIGFFNSWGDTSSDPNHFYIDDAYIDNTWARVELGNASTLAACTHREIQPSTSWSASQVTVNFNPGSFAPGSVAYLFAVDANGTASAGYPVTIGGSVASGPGQPGKPTF